MPSSLFFGPPANQLYGVYHEPQSSHPSAIAALICSPSPQEYMQAHWALRRLATLLAEDGVHTLRFDYFGMGDSAGETSDGTLERWEDDVLRARHKLSELSGLSRISLIGFRLGAVLAWRASIHCDNKPRDLVLWDPIVRGRSYLQELSAQDEVFAVRLLYHPTVTEPPRELSGYVLPHAQWAATQAIDLLSEPLPKATQTALLVSQETTETARLSKRLGDALKRQVYAYVPDGQVHSSGSLLCGPILHAIRRVLLPKNL